MKIIVGVDDSTYSKAAIRYVADATWPQAAHFIVVSAVMPVLTGPGESVSSIAIEQVLEEQESRYRKIAANAAAELRRVGLSVEARVVRGDPRSALEEEARKKGAKLIVVGSHGWTGLKKLLLGSVASHVVTHAACSVLVVKMPLRRRAQSRSATSRRRRS